MEIGVERRGIEKWLNRVAQKKSLEAKLAKALEKSGLRENDEVRKYRFRLRKVRERLGEA